jgi:hypothetical protein
MTIIRCAHDQQHPYVMVTRGVAQSRTLSYGAIGLLTYLLSKPDDWTVVPEDLIRKGYGRDKVYKLLKELKDAGHISQERGNAAHNAPPMWGERIVMEAPNPEKPDTATVGVEVSPFPDLPYTAEPYTVNAIYGETALTNQEKEHKQEIKQTERDAPARESTPLTFAHANGLGQSQTSLRSNGQNPAVLAVKAHPVFQAYVRGRGNIEPEVPPPNAPGMLETLKAIQADIDAKRYGLQDVEDLTRFKVGIPHSKAFLLSYIKTDIADFVGARNANGSHAPARASPPPPTVPSTSAGAPTLRPVRALAALPKEVAKSGS